MLLVVGLHSLLLCLGAMGLGSLLKLRLYLLLGFSALVVDLASIMVKVLRHLEGGPRMTAVGALVLLLGAALVGGSIYHKTHREELNARLQAWRRKLGDWE